jgi:uncharacterized phage protein (TIGR02220 family)
MKVSDYQENYMTGWVRLYRSIRDKGWFKKSEYVHLWIYLIVEASHTEKEYLWNGKNIKLKAGQFITGRKKISENTGICQSNVERILKCFENEQQIEQLKTSTSRCISILNYEQYQVSEQRLGQRQDNGRTTAGQRQDTKQECKELKNEYKDYITFLNETFNRKYKGADKIETSFKARINEGRTLEDFKTAIITASKEKYHIESDFKYLTPEFFTRAEKLDKFTSKVDKPKTNQDDLTYRQSFDDFWGRTKP